MTTYTAIPNSDVDVDSPITTSLVSALRDNPLAIQEGDGTAPRIAQKAIDCVVVGARSSSNTAITNAAAGTTLVFDSTTIDTNTVLNTTTGIFTIPIDGVYEFSAFVGIEIFVGTASVYEIAIQINNVDYLVRSSEIEGLNVPVQANVGFIADLNAGDEIKVDTQRTGGSNIRYHPTSLATLKMLGV